ncbi:unnamed protein product, partial [Prorocentrum cordatum]
MSLRSSAPRLFAPPLPSQASCPRCRQVPAWRTPRAGRAAATDSFGYASREEERVVKTALHELGTQHEKMKLSLKAFHFQELSRTSLRDVTLRRDNRYERLKEDLLENVGSLSPAQLVAAVISAGRLRMREPAGLWRGLVSGISRHTVQTASGASGLQFSQICLVMHALGKAQVKVKVKFYYRMLRFMVRRPELWTEFDMAWILGAMRRRGLRARSEESPQDRLWAKVTLCIAAYFRQKLHFISPRGIVFIMYEFARLGVYPGRCVFRAAKRVRQHLPSLNDRALVALAVVLAKFDWPDMRLLRKMSHVIREPRRFVRMHPSLLIIVLHSYAKLAVREVPLIEAVGGVIARGAGQLDERSCAVAAYSLGRLGVRGPAWGPLAERVASRAEVHPPLHLPLLSADPTIAHAFGKVSIRDRRLLAESLADASLASVAGFSPKQLCCLLDGMTLAGFYREDLFRAALDEYVRLGSAGSWARRKMMHRILSSLRLEAPGLLKDAPAGWQTLVEQASRMPVKAEERDYHAELELCAEALSLTGAKTRFRKGPHIVDLSVVVDATTSGSGQEHAAVAVSLTSQADHCPLTGELLGPARLRRRQLAQVRWLHLEVNRRQWLALPDSEARTAALEALLSPFVATRRRPISEVEPL